MAFSSIPEVIEELRAGRMIVLTDDQDRENEGDLVALADRVTPDQLNFMLKEARGVMCRMLDLQAQYRFEYDKLCADTSLLYVKSYAQTQRHQQTHSKRKGLAPKSKGRAFPLQRIQVES